MIAWFARRGARERVLLAAGAAALLLAAGVGLVWLPLRHQVAGLDRAVAQSRDLERWMRTAAVEVRNLRGAAAPAARPSGAQSLLSVVDQTAKQGALGKALRRVEPEGATKVRIHFEQAGFDDLLRWLEHLDAAFGVRVEAVTIDRQEKAGLVNARLTLAGEA